MHASSYGVATVAVAAASVGLCFEMGAVGIAHVSHTSFDPLLLHSPE